MDEITVCGQGLTNEPLHSASFFSKWLLFLCTAFIAVAYVFAILFLRKRNSAWIPVNAIAFFIGIAMVLVAFSPGLMLRGHDSVKVHMVQHILAAMFAPIFLVLGKPVTLMLRVIPTRLARKLMGILRSRVVLCLSHPLAAFVLNMGGMFALYLTDLYTAALNNPVLHFVIHVHFLLAGYVFTWSIIGLDPVPVRPGFKMKVAVVFLTIACHAFLAKFMYAFNFPSINNGSFSEVQEAAKLMYYWGDVSELILLVALFANFYLYDRKTVPPVLDAQSQKVAISPLLPLHSQRRSTPSCRQRNF